MRNKHLVVVAMGLVAVGLAVSATDAVAQSVDFSKADDVGNSFVTWIRGNIATVFFTVALVLSGFAAAFNRISWMWVLMIALGALLVFGAPGIVADLKAAFS